MGFWLFGITGVRVLDLFSGIGGFSLGLERAGFKTIAFCEINEWCRRVLSKHWPNVQQMADVTTIGIEPMSSAGDFPAKTLALPGEAPAYPVPVPLSGGGYAEPFAWYDRPTRSWRTWQRCLIVGWEMFAETWPRSGMTRNGIAYRLPTLAHRTNEIESGSWPTPTAAMADRGCRGDLLAWVRGYENKHYPRQWPTPTSRDYKDGSAKSCANVPSNGLLGREIHKGSTALGSLNPTWVEWLMGYPLGWTVLKDWVTPSSRKSPKSSGGQS